MFPIQNNIPQFVPKTYDSYSMIICLLKLPHNELLQWQLNAIAFPVFDEFIWPLLTPKLTLPLFSWPLPDSVFRPISSDTLLPYLYFPPHFWQICPLYSWNFCPFQFWMVNTKAVVSKHDQDKVGIHLHGYCPSRNQARGPSQPDSPSHVQSLHEHKTTMAHSQKLARTHTYTHPNTITQSRAQNKIYM